MKPTQMNKGGMLKGGMHLDTDPIQNPVRAGRGVARSPRTTTWDLASVVSGCNHCCQASRHDLKKLSAR